MVGAEQEVTAAVEASNRIWLIARPIALLATLDLKNVFNTVAWEDIPGSLKSLIVPSLLMRMAQDYISQRILLYTTRQY